jgi:hypothetical protein
MYRRGQGTGADKWVLVLQGGGACNTVETCEGRAELYKSSIPWQRESLDESWGLVDGILNPLKQNNPHFYNWNHVFFIYCTSDTWVGQRTDLEDSFNMQFSGHLVIEAIIDALQDEHLIGAPALSSAEEVLFGGSSAGAAGVRNNVDWVAELLHSDGIDAKFGGILDAGVGPLKNLDETYEAPRVGWFVWQPFIDADCAAAHAQTGDPWTCTSGEYLRANNFINTPLFIYHDQNDPATKSNYRGDDFQPRMQKIMGSLPNVFSPDKGIHYILTKTRFYDSSAVFPEEFIAGYENSLYLEAETSYTFSDLLWLWYSQEPD